VRVTKSLRGLRVAGATVLALCLAWCCTSCSPAARRVTSPTGVASARPSTAVATSPKTTSGRQLWVNSLRGAYGGVGAVSPDGTTVFVSGLVQGRRVKTHYETVAYRAATGARLWASSYQPGGNLYSYPVALTVSPDGARVYVSTDFHFIGRGQGVVTFAYDARTGRQLWASRYRPKGSGAGVSGLAVSPDGTTLYVAGTLGQAHSLFFGVIAYAAATGKQRWLRYSTGMRGEAASVAVSPDGKTVYATGSGGSSVLTVAYQATGTVKWAARYKNPYADVYDAGTQIVAGPGGNIVYVVGRAANKSGHHDIATFAYRTATGTQLWLDRYQADLGGSMPRIAVTPDGQTVIVTGALTNGRTGYAALASYSASTGETRWTAKAPLAGPTGLVIDPHGNTVFVGGNRTTAYSVAHGTVLWTTSYNHNFPDFGALSGIIGLSGDGTRLFAARQTKRGITWSIAIVAYRT